MWIYDYKICHLLFIRYFSEHLPVDFFYPRLWTRLIRGDVSKHTSSSRVFFILGLVLVYAWSLETEVFVYSEIYVWSKKRWKRQRGSAYRSFNVIHITWNIKYCFTYSMLIRNVVGNFHTYHRSTRI